jgi:hypothetical protein
MPEGGRSAWQDQSGRAAYTAHLPALLGGNTAWAQQYAAEIKQIIHRQASRAPRSVQRHLGPSELGVVCERQPVWKLAGEKATNHVADPWPSILGTAAHAWLAQAMQDENDRIGVLRFLAELPVAPHPMHRGTTDLYDALEQACCDWKVLGPTSMAKIMSPAGPPRRYRVQLLLYWLGIIRMGLPARRVVLIALPRTAASLDSMYVWELQPGPDDVALIGSVLADTARRRETAALVRAGVMPAEAVPFTPDSDECYFCPFYRPQAARDNDGGCPGAVSA